MYATKLLVANGFLALLFAGVVFTAKIDKGCPMSAGFESGYSSGRTLMAERNQGEIENFLQDLHSEAEDLFRHAFWRGEPVQHFRSVLRDMNTKLRANYAELRKNIANTVLPVVIMSDSDPGEPGTGTTVTLYDVNGKIHRYVPTHKDYEVYKNLAHIGMGIFGYLAPYVHTPNSIGWIPGLKDFQATIQEALVAYKAEVTEEMIEKEAKKMQGNADMNMQGDGMEDMNMENTPMMPMHMMMMDMGTGNGKMVNLVSATLTTADEYITSIISRKSLSEDELSSFVKKLIPFCRESMKKAVHLQTSALLPFMQKLKRKLGSRWNDTYFLVPTVPTVRDINIRFQVLETVLSERHFKTHVIIAENAKNHDEARDILGRWISDRALAQIAFTKEDPETKELRYALSSTEDLLSRFADEEIKNILPTLETCSKK